VLRALRSTVYAQFGEAKDAASTLADFGFTPRKVPQRLVTAKAQAGAKRAATRKARQVMGKNQRKKVKGTVEAPAPTTASPATPQGAPGTAKPAA